jgi:hypothetical protein
MSEDVVRALLTELRQADDAMVAASGKALKRHIEALPPARRRQAVGPGGLRIKRGEKARLRFAAMIDAVLEPVADSGIIGRPTCLHCGWLDGHAVSCPWRNVG